MAEIRILSIETPSIGKLYCNILVEGEKKVVVAEASKNVAEYLVTDRADAFVIALLYSAMQKGYDIVSDVPVSEELIYNIENQFIDALALPGTGLRRIKVVAPKAAKYAMQGNIVATGISCGVDSLFTIATHSDDNFPQHKLTHLAFYNVGSNDRGMGDEDTQKLYEGRYNLCKAFADEYGYEFYTVSSNMNKIIIDIVGDYSHVSNHTYVNAYCTMLLQKGVSKYYYSAGYGYELFRARRLNEKEEFDASHYDLLSLNAFSTSNTRFYSVGAAVLRRDKTQMLVDYKPANKYLNVCVNSVKNDCTCFKCVRTLLTIDACGALDKFQESFDIAYYKRNRKWYLEQLYIEAQIKHDPLMEEIYPMFDGEMSLPLKIGSILKKTVSVFHNHNRLFPKKPI